MHTAVDVARARLSSVVRYGLFVLLVIRAIPTFSQGRAFPSDWTCRVRESAEPRQLIDPVINLKILLVQFSDVRCRLADDGSSPRYTAADFENLLGSQGIYVSPAMYSPDGDEVFGSMDDYFNKMSGGKLGLHAFVVNRNDTLSGKPVWITLGNSKQYYQERSVDFFYDAFDAADAAGLDISLSENTRLAVIYAGNTYFLNGGLNPMAWGLSYIMSEVQGKPYNVETREARFARIGIHCHEFAHTIDVGHTTGGRADLMYGGTSNGSVGGNCPAPLNAIARARQGWARVVPVESVSGQGVDIPYSLTDPTVYVMKNSAGDQFYIENRRFDQTMMIGTTVVPDYNNVKFFPPAGPHGTITQGIFVWRVNTTGDRLDEGYSTEGLVYASGRYGRTYPENDPSDTDDGVPFPGVSNTRLFTPWSDPRNPYGKETDFFGSGGTHYTLFAPNTKGGANCGMEVISEDRSGGTFRVKFYTSNPPNPAQSLLPSSDSLGSYDRMRTVAGTQAGTLHQVMELGGEILCRRSTDGGRSWAAPALISQGNGGNSAPSIARAGTALLVAWQMDAYDAADTGRVILLSRSTDAGMTWSNYVSAGWSYRCGAPGGYPTLSGGNNGTAVLVYRADRNYLVSEVSHDAGVSWSGVVQVPVGDIAWSTTSVAVNDSEALIAYSSDSLSPRARVICNRFAFGAGSWGSPAGLSDILTQEYAGFGKPFFVSGLQGVAGRLDVAWDATDAFGGGIPLVLSRRVDGQQLASSFTVFKLTSRSDFPASGISFPSIPGGPSWSYARVLTIMDSARASSVSIEIGLTRLLRGGGSADTIRFAAVSADSLQIDAGGLTQEGCTVPVTLESDNDTLAVAAAVYGYEAGTLSAGGQVGFEIVCPGSDTAIARFAVHSLASISSGSRTLMLYSVPVSTLPLTGRNRTIALRPFFTGLGGGGFAASLAQVYSAWSENPAGRLITGGAAGGQAAHAPHTFVLEQNYPNPFNPSTTIRYAVPAKMRVRLSVYNTLGQQVALLVDEVEEPGVHEVRFEAGNIASGSYFYRIQAGEYSQTKRLLLLK